MFAERVIPNGSNIHPFGAKSRHEFSQSSGTLDEFSLREMRRLEGTGSGQSRDVQASVQHDIQHRIYFVVQQKKLSRNHCLVMDTRCKGHPRIQTDVWREGLVVLNNGRLLPGKHDLVNTL